MSNKYAKTFFTQSVKACQARYGSRRIYQRMAQGNESNRVLRDVEIEFIAQRNSFYLASVGETGWPYVQHRGGPAGFVKVVDNNTLGYADFSGNRQYISAGNIQVENRVSLLFMDYPNQQRLKIAGRSQLVDNSEWDMLEKIEPVDYDARIERIYLIHVEAFDWNCPRHITPRYTEQELKEIYPNQI